MPYRVSGGGSGVKERVKIMEKDLVGENRKPWVVAQEEVVDIANCMTVCRAGREGSEEYMARSST